MLIKNKYPRGTLKFLEGEWREVMLLFQQLCTGEHRMTDDGVMVERVTVKQFPPETFINCVYTIIEQINDAYGAMAVDDVYRQLDFATPHKNVPPASGAKEYNYCCDRFYERSIIFGGVYYVLAIQNPELTDVLEKVYTTANYPDAIPYLNHFINALKHRSENNEEMEDFIDPCHIPDIQALDQSYRYLSPKKRKLRYQQILLSIESLAPEERTSQINMLYITVSYALRILIRTYGLYEEREYIPESEKLTMTEIIRVYKARFADQKDVIVPFIKSLLEIKIPSAQDSSYEELLNDNNISETQECSDIIEKIIKSGQSGTTILNFNAPVGNVNANVEQLNVKKE